MHFIQICPVGDNLADIYITLRDFPTERVLFVTSGRPVPQELLEDLEKFRIQQKVVKMEGDPMEFMVELISNLKRGEGEDRIIVNAATGDRIGACIALTAAYINGVRAVGVMDGQSLVLPILKLSYYRGLSDKKMGLLKQMFKAGDEMSLEDLAKASRMALPLLLYHVVGDRHRDGLKPMGLVDYYKRDGKTFVKLTKLGRLLVKGHLQLAPEVGTPGRFVSKELAP